ncbi:unnamed protein product [Euphydryas editha]|nr:unnamed protein product [Euphydryas editha]
MPLTNAEKQRRYRERLKQDPEKFENYRKKNLERIKSKYKYKKVSELNDREKSEVRRKWREQKRQKKTENNTIETVTPTSAEITSTTSEITAMSSVKSIQRSRNMYRKKYNTSQNRIITLLRQNEALRKKLYRIQKKQRETIDTLQLDILKLQARNEFLEKALKDTYKSCKNNNERNVLKRIAVQKSTTQIKAKTYMLNMLGVKGGIKKKKEKEKKIVKIKTEVEKFF